MKIICTNIENCASIEDYVGEEPAPYCTLCTSCGSIAFIYMDEKNCIYKKDYSKPDIDNIILKTIIKLQISEKNDKPTEK